MQTGANNGNTQKMVENLTFVYAEHGTRKGPRALSVDLFLPDTKGPFPLLIWMHSGDFRNGSRDHPDHSLIAAEFASHGYAMAAIDYRLARPQAALTPSVAASCEGLIAEAVASGEEMHKTFYGPRPLGVVEDCCAFLNHIHGRRAEFHLSGRYLLGGSSAGAISALNTLYLPSRIGLSRPGISTVFAFSGGFPYTPSLSETGARIFATHNPGDVKMPISSMRRFAETTRDICMLVECDVLVHGDLTLDPQEPLSAAVARCVTFDQAKHPLRMDI